MNVSVASFKGGVGKTTTAVHLAGYLHKRGRTLLIDGDHNRSASGWAARGGFPFDVVDERQAAGRGRDYAHVVVDTEARPTAEDIRVLAAQCDLLVLPVTPDAMALEALMLTVQAVPADAAFRILLTIVPPPPSRDGDHARTLLRERQWPVFTAMIPRAVAFTKAALLGRLVSDVPDPRAARAWAAYVAVGKEMFK